MIRQLERWGAIGAAAALFLLMLVVLADVLGRNVLNRPLPGGTELTEILMVAFSFLSFPLLTYRQRHITVDIFDFMTGPLLRKFQVALSSFVGAVVFGLLSYQLVVFAGRAARSGEATSELHIPLSYVWWFMAAFAAVTAVAALVVAIAAFTHHPIQPTPASEID